MSNQRHALKPIISKRKAEGTDSHRHVLSFQVRRATLRDLNILVHQRRGMWEDMGIGTKRELDRSDDAYRRWARTHMKSGKLLGWIAETAHKEIVGGGCLWLQPIQPRPGAGPYQPYLLSMFTEPHFRGNGVASRIVREAVKWCKRNHCGRLSLHASNKGRRLYRRHGFERTWEMRLKFRKSG